jgi:MFS family permease
MMLGILPSVLIGSFSGVIVDRINRKAILVSMDLIRGAIVLTMGILLYYNNLQKWVLYLGTILISICTSFYSPACSASIPNIVEDENLTKANSLDSVAVNASQIIGSLFGALLYTLLGIVAIFFINAVSYTISGISQSFIYMKDRDVNKNNFWKELKDGCIYILNHKGLRTLILFFIGINFLLAPTMEVYLPFIFNKLIYANASQLAYVRVAFGVGIVIGAIVSSLLPQKEKKHSNMVFGFTIFSITMFGFVIPLFPSIRGIFSQFYLILFYIITAIMCGSFFGIGIITTNVIFQKEVHDDFRGRVISLILTFGTAAMPIGYLFGGFIAESAPMYMILMGTAGFLLLLSVSMGFSKNIKGL